MPYNVNFIGLTFFEDLAGGGRRALMPDGRVPPPDIQSHWPSIAISSADFRGRSGWLSYEVSENPPQFEYFFPPSIVTFPTSDSLPNLNATELDPWLIHLRDRDPEFELSADPEYVASVTIMHGMIKAYRVPNMPDPARAQYFARWTVPHDNQDFTIMLVERRGWLVRTLTVAAGSEISIINTSRGTPPATATGDHFRLYEQLSGVEIDLSTPPEGHIVEAVWPDPLLVFTNPQPATLELGCSPTNGGTP